MKNSFKYIMLIALAVFWSCEDEDKLPFERITREAPTAGGLRTINIISPTIDLLDIANSEFSVEVEEWDDQDGGLLESVDVFVQFQDQTPDNGDSSAPEVLISNIPASTFSVNGTSGLPRATITVPAQDAVAILGLDITSDIDGGDIFRFRLALNLTDGSVFSSGNLEGNITGVFFSSPFSYPANVVCNIEDTTIFTGDYQLEFISGTFDAFGGSDAYASGPVTITANSGTQRVVQNVQYLPSLGPFSGQLIFDLVCGRTVVPEQMAPAGCGPGIVQQSGTENLGRFDINDDSEFTVIFNDETTSACGATPYEVVLRFTKM